MATFLANGGLETKANSIYGKQGLKIKLTGGDDFVAQVRDYNGSGQADILWRSPTDERVVVWQMTGSAIEGTAVVGELGPDWAVH